MAILVAQSRRCRQRNDRLDGRDRRRSLLSSLLRHTTQQSASFHQSDTKKVRPTQQPGKGASAATPIPRKGSKGLILARVRA